MPYAYLTDPDLAADFLKARRSFRTKAGGPSARLKSRQTCGRNPSGRRGSLPAIVPRDEVRAPAPLPLRSDSANTRSEVALSCDAPLAKQALAWQPRHMSTMQVRVELQKTCRAGERTVLAHDSHT
jgi:hypothetical protein